MRIGVIAEHYPPTEGGVATSARRIARHLRALGASVQVATFDHSRPLTSEDYIVVEEDGGTPVVRVGPFFLKQPGKSVDALPEKLRATLRRRALGQISRVLGEAKVDVVLSLYLLNAGFLALFAARELGVPCVAGVRGNDIGRNIFNVERFAVVQWVVNGAAAVVCVNEHLKRRLLLAFPESRPRVSVIANSIELAPRTPAEASPVEVRRRLGWQDAQMVAVFIGTLREKKGVAALLLAIARLRQRADIRLLVVGPDLGNSERSLCGGVWEQLLSEHRAFATGRVARDEVPAWAAAGDVVVMPSLDDGLANGLLEGMALGLCPVASTPIFDDVVEHERNGLLVDAGQSDAIAGALLRLAADAALRRKLGHAAREGLARWQPGDEAAAYLRLCEEVVERGGARRSNLVSV